jgi:hypothetical protein
MMNPSLRDAATSCSRNIWDIPDLGDACEAEQLHQRPSTIVSYRLVHHDAAPPGGSLLRLVHPNQTGLGLLMLSSVSLRS